MKLDEVRASVTEQLNTQANLGVQIVEQKDIPKEGPASGGLWWRIPGATAVFADIKRSTSISVNGSRKDAAYAYTYFLRAMAVIFDKFGARYIDIQGDGVFGLFSGKDATFSAAACAITMKTHMERVLSPGSGRTRRPSRALRSGSVWTRVLSWSGVWVSGIPGRMRCGRAGR